MVFNEKIVKINSQFYHYQVGEKGQMSNLCKNTKTKEIPKVLKSGMNQSSVVTHIFILFIYGQSMEKLCTYCFRVPDMLVLNLTALAPRKERIHKPCRKFG